jgi:hypothetical protein
VNTVVVGDVAQVVVLQRDKEGQHDLIGNLEVVTDVTILKNNT